MYIIYIKYLNDDMPYSIINCLFNVFSEMCLEKRAFFRILSGMHTSINVHLSAVHIISGLYFMCIIYLLSFTNYNYFLGR